MNIAKASVYVKDYLLFWQFYLPDIVKICQDVTLNDLFYISQLKSNFRQGLNHE